jgi:hypothetical protein
MLCPACQSPETVRDGTSSYGVQRYLCRSCGKWFTGNPKGRRPKNGVAMPGAERTRLHYQRKKAEGEALMRGAIDGVGEAINAQSKKGRKSKAIKEKTAKAPPKKPRKNKSEKRLDNNEKH